MAAIRPSAFKPYATGVPNSEMLEFSKMEHSVGSFVAKLAASLQIHCEMQWSLHFFSLHKWLRNQLRRTNHVLRAICTKLSAIYINIAQSAVKSALSTTMKPMRLSIKPI